jgi:hypothetical protein
VGSFGPIHQNTSQSPPHATAENFFQSHESDPRKSQPDNASFNYQSHRAENEDTIDFITEKNSSGNNGKYPNGSDTLQYTKDHDPRSSWNNFLQNGRVTLENPNVNPLVLDRADNFPRRRNGEMPLKRPSDHNMVGDSIDWGYEVEVIDDTQEGKRNFKGKKNFSNKNRL